MAGGAVASLAGWFLAGELTLLHIAVGIIGGAFPDFDSTNSKIAHMGFRIKKGVKIKPFMIPAMIGQSLMEHRTYTHTLVSVGIAGIVAYVLFWVFSVPQPLILATIFALGWLSHLVLDGMTPFGVPFLWPKKKVRTCQHVLPKQWRIKTGGAVDNLIGLLLLLVFLVGLGAAFFTGNLVEV